MRDSKVYSLLGGVAILWLFAVICHFSYFDRLLLTRVLQVKDVVVPAFFYFESFEDYLRDHRNGTKALSTIIQKPSLVCPNETIDNCTDKVYDYIICEGKVAGPFLISNAHSAQDVFPCLELWSLHPFSNHVYTREHVADIAKMSDGIKPFFTYMNITIMDKVSIAKIPSQKPCRMLKCWVTAGNGVNQPTNFTITSRTAAILKTQMNITDPQNSTSLRIGVLNRLNSRKFENESTLLAALDSSLNDMKGNLSMKLIVDLVYFENKMIEYHAKWMHSHDIIIAPHGAALTNSVFIRPCTVVLEVFPASMSDTYFLPLFYGPLVSAVGGIHFLAYRGNFTEEHLHRSRTYHERSALRALNFKFDDSTWRAFFQMVLPNLIQRYSACIAKKK